MTKDQIMQILPHRDPMLLIEDASLDGEWGVGHYQVRGDEWFLQGHFPGKPIVPGVILCEMLAQSACVLLKDLLEPGKLPVYNGLDQVKFRSPVLPGDLVTTRCKIKRAKHPFYFAEGSVLVGDRVCVTANFSFAITGA